MPMSMSKVLSSDSSEHSTPLSSNQERPVRTSNFLNDAPLMRSLSVLDDIDKNEQLSARQPPSTTSQRGPPSGQVATPSTSSSTSTRRPSLPFQWQLQGQGQEKQQSRGPPSPESLARHGIKVRDFAYESNLPMIPSIPRVRQLVTARPLKRTKRYFEQPSDVFTVDTPSQSQSVAARSFQASSPSLLLDQGESAGSQSNPLERKSTEPVIFPERESGRPYRHVGYADLSQIPSGSQAAQTNLRDTLTPTTPTAVDRMSTFSPVSLPFPFPPTRRLTTLGGSQESESSTDTPLVTPNGSLTWPTITSDLTASQLDHNNSSQAPALVHDTTAAYSQLGFPPPISQAPDSYSGAGTADAQALGSPRPTEVASSPPQPPLDEDAAGDDGHNARTSSSPSPTPTRLSHATRPPTSLGSPLKSSTASSPRYFLRKHGSPRQEYASTPSPHRRRRSSIKAPAPYPVRVPPATRQAAHAAAPGSSGRSPRAKPLRKTAL